MHVDKQDITERLLYLLVKAAELKMELKAIDNLMDYSTPPQEGLDQAITSASNLQIRLINTIKLV